MILNCYSGLCRAYPIVTQSNHVWCAESFGAHPNETSEAENLSVILRKVGCKGLFGLLESACCGFSNEG